MTETPPRPRANPNSTRAWIMRAAGDMIGSERLAAALGISSRTAYRLMAGRRPVSDGILRDTAKLLILHRQTVAAIGRCLRQELNDEDR